MSNWFHITLGGSAALVSLGVYLLPARRLRHHLAITCIGAAWLLMLVLIMRLAGRI